MGTDKQGHSVLPPPAPAPLLKMQHSGWLTWGWSQTTCPLLSGNTPCLWPNQSFLSFSTLRRPIQYPLHTAKVSFPDCCAYPRPPWAEPSKDGFRGKHVSENTTKRSSLLEQMPRHRAPQITGATLSPNPLSLIHSPSILIHFLSAQLLQR